MKTTRSALVADDDSAIRNLVVELVEGLGFLVIACATGRDALRAARMHNFDLVVTDNDLGDDREFSGVQVIRRAQHHTEYVRTILMSGRDAEEHTADEFFAKPFDINRLQNAISAWFPDS